MTYCTFFESEGAHGLEQRLYRNEYEKVKRRNDDIDERNAKKRDQWERAGYGDKVKPADRRTENNLKSRMNRVKSKRANRGYEVGDVSYDDNTYAGNKIKDQLKRYKDRPENQEGRHHPVHTRINNRVHESGIFGNIDII